VYHNYLSVRYKRETYLVCACTRSQVPFFSHLTPIAEFLLDSG